MAKEYYKLRVDIVPRLDIDVYRTLETRYFTSYVRCRESGSSDSNDHYHYFAVLTSNSRNVREFIRTNIGKGNAVYSMKKVDEEAPIEYLAYLMKEDPDTCWHNMPSGLKEEALAYDKEVKASIKKNTKTPAWKKVETYVKSQCDGIIPDDVGRVIECAIEYYITEGVMVRSFLIQSVVETILLKNSPSYKRDYINKMKSRVNGFL